jgi:hypothetical protein
VRAARKESEMKWQKGKKMEETAFDGKSFFGSRRRFADPRESKTNFRKKKLFVFLVGIRAPSVEHF